MNSFTEWLSDINLEHLLNLSKTTDPIVIEQFLKQNKIPLGAETFSLLISPAGQKHIEKLAQLAKKITLQRFGNIIQLYAPLYISNECTNTCTYCGFTQENKINRKSLTKEECQQEAQHLYNRGFRDLLIVSGEHQKIVTSEYVGQMIQACKTFFPSIAIETAPFSQEEYKYLVKQGVQTLTVYQETYHKETYKNVHLYGKKKNYQWRIDAPERGAKAGIRKINMGILLGLSKYWDYDSILTTLHLEYMMKKYWNIQYGVSVPRICESETLYKPAVDVSDLQLAQIIFAYRIAFPDLTISLSTRENANLRDGLFGLGVTHISAESSTEPGGYCNPNDALKQFNISDERTLENIIKVIKQKNLEPVWKNWHSCLTG